MRVYLAARWSCPNHSAVLEILRNNGCRVYDFKTHEYAFDWRELLGENAFKPVHPGMANMALRSVKVRKAYKADMEALANSDLVVAIAPFGVSVALELGIAAGLGKRTAIYLGGQTQPETMMCAADQIFDSSQRLVDWINDGWRRDNEIFTRTGADPAPAARDVGGPDPRAPHVCDEKCCWSCRHGQHGDCAERRAHHRGYEACPCACNNKES